MTPDPRSDILRALSPRIESALTGLETVPSPHPPCTGASGIPAAISSLILLLAAVSPAQAADPDFPRLGLYGHVAGTGAPIVKPDESLDATLLDAIARRHTVVLDATPFTEYRPDALAALRARRPDIKLLGYVQAQYIWPASQADSNVNLPTRIRIMVRNLNGFLYDRQGEEFRNANINLAKRNAQGRFVVAEAIADFFVDQVCGPGDWDGLFLDRFCNSILWDQEPADSIDFVRAGYPNAASFDAAWTAGTDTLANRMRRRAGSVPILIGNCAQGTKYASFNGWMRENFPFQGGGSWDSNVLAANGGYLSDQAKFRAPYAGWMTAWPAPGVPSDHRENLRRARHTLASAALGEGYGTINPPDLDPTTGYMSWWFDEYAVDLISGAASTSLDDTGWLGQALGPYSRMVWAQPGVEDACDQNPSFESSVTTGWTFLQTNGATVTRDLSTYKDGIASAKIALPNTTGGPAAVRYRSVGDVFWVTDTYAATFWAKASTARTIEVAAVNVSNGQTMAAAVESLKTTWTRHQVRLDGTFGYARLELRVGGVTGSVWFDDVHLQRGAPFVYRRDFENGVVLVNVGAEQLEVALERKLRRIAGIRDPLVNDGSFDSDATIAPGDAAFLLVARDELVAADPDPSVHAGERLRWASIAPNPSRRDESAVRLALAVAAGADGLEVTLHDVAGRLVRRFDVDGRASGMHTLAWDGRDAAGRIVPTGVYFARARTGDVVAVRKFIRTD